MGVDLKVDRLNALNLAISTQVPERRLHESWLAELLIISMPEEYATEIAIIESNKDILSFEDVTTRLRARETALSAPPDESVNYASTKPVHRAAAKDGSARRWGSNESPEKATGECWGCQKPLPSLPHKHRKVVCPEFLAQPTSKEWLKSFKGRQWIGHYEKEFGKIEKANSARVIEVEDEYEMLSICSEVLLDHVTISMNRGLYPSISRSQRNQTFRNENKLRRQAAMIPPILPTKYFINKKTDRAFGWKPRMSAHSAYCAKPKKYPPPQSLSTKASLSDDEQVLEHEISCVAHEQDNKVNHKKKVTTSSPRITWLLDSGASIHMTPDRSAFSGELEPSSRTIQVANGSVITAKGKGEVIIEWQNETTGQPRKVQIKDVLWVPQSSESLISLGLLNERGVEFSTNKDSMTLTLGDKVFCKGIRKGRIWHLHQTNYFPKALSAQEVALASTAATKQGRLHARLGHPGITRSGQYSSVVNDLGGTLKSRFCEVCALSKMTRKIERNPLPVTNTPLAVLHMDLCGPYPVVSLNKKAYMLTVTDQATRRVWTRFRADKKDVPQDVEDIIKEAEADSERLGNNYKVKKLHFDRGREFLNKAMSAFCDRKSIVQDPTVGYNPEANGIAERLNRTLMEISNAIRIHAGLPPAYWEFATACATYLHNRGPVQGRDITPWEAWYQERPSVKRYRVFGAPAYVHIPDVKRKKLDMKAWKGIFIGYSERNPGIYLIYNTSTCKVHEAKFVIFDELFSRRTYSELAHDQHLDFKALVERNGYETTWKGPESENSDSSDSEDDQENMAASPSDDNSGKSGANQPKPNENVDFTPESPQIEANVNKRIAERGTSEDENAEPTHPTSPKSSPPHSPKEHENGPPTPAPEDVDSDSELSTISDQEMPEEPRWNREGDGEPVAPPKKISATRMKQIAAQKRKEQKLAVRAQENADREAESVANGDRRNSKRKRTARDKASVARLLSQPRKTILRLPGRIPIPLTVAEAQASDHAEGWQGAMEKEIESIKGHGTLSREIEKPKDLTDNEIITAKFVFDIKYDENGDFVAYKARLVARGFTQIHGVNYEDTFAPTMAFDALRIILAIAAKKGWRVRQLDVVTAFLNGRLEERVIMKVPPSLVNIFGEYVQVLKSLYGLKQAARVWFKMLQGYFETIGFTSEQTDESVMMSHPSGVHIVIGIYVDDLLITGENDEEIEKVIAKLKQRFKMKDLGLARNVLGMRILRDGDKLSLDQTRYAAEIVSDFYFENAPIYDTPMDHAAVKLLELEPGKALAPDAVTTFLKLLGKLNWLCHTRPDIVFAVHRIQQHSANPGSNHLAALYRVLGYIAGTLNFGLVYGLERGQVEGVTDVNYYKLAEKGLEVFVGSSRNDETLVNAFSDSDFAQNPTDSKSITGMALFVNGAVVSFASQKQKGVSSSTPEAEYIALSDTTRRLLWVNQFAIRVEGKEQQWNEDGQIIGGRPVPLLFGDNKASVIISQGLKSTSKIRHIQRSYHHILDETKKGHIEVYWIAGKDQLADGFTKPLPRPEFIKKRHDIGVRDISKVMKKSGGT